MVDIPKLQLVKECKISELMSHRKPVKRWEASGVLVRDGHFFVVFDDRTEVARIASELEPDAKNGLFGMADAVYGYEGIAYNAARRQYYLLVEARKHADDCYKAVIVEYDDEFNYRKERPADFAFRSDNKGFEAIAHVRREERDYLLALCEGNKCKCGKQGRKPGGGRILLFEKKRKRWRHTRTIALPSSVPFVDYSGMSIKSGRVAVVSQVNSMLWVGQFDEADWDWRDDGKLYEFPRAGDGAIQYGNIEGVGWITPTRIVVVSDRRKKSSQPEKALSKKDQSVHIFDLPT
ncbi:MAG: hypothetical protein AB7G28_00640 [Pirellulales bacterium]